MESQSAASPRFPPPRRVATEPTPFQAPRRSLSVSSTSSRPGFTVGPRISEDPIETLYNHPSVKIIAFTSSQRTSFGPSNPSNEPEPGSLPASSQLERTIAIGPFRIYRAPGSVAFLSCGSALQPILPKSQCWCIDEANSRFVLQIRRPQYWRIEIPISDPEDGHLALNLREVFDNILLFEKTECPFQRSFTVQLPERPQTPVKKKPWTPVGKKLVSSPFFSDYSPPSPPSKVAIEKRHTKLNKEEASVDIDGITSTEARETATQAEPVCSGKSTQAPGVDNDKIAGTRAVTPTDATAGEAREQKLDVVYGVHEQGREITSTDVADDKQASEAATELQLRPKERVVPETFTLKDAHEACNESIPMTTQTLPNIPPSEDQALTADSDQIPTETRSPERSDSAGSIAITGDQDPVACKEILADNVPGEKAVPCSPFPEQVPDAVTRRKLSVPATLPEEDVTREEVIEDTEEEGPASFEGAGSVGVLNLRKKRMSRVLAGRSVTLPPQLTLVTSPPSKSMQPLPTEKPPQTPQEPEEMSPVGSIDSFHSVQSWHSPITPFMPSPPSSSPSPPSFPFPHENIILSNKGPSHVRDVSDLTSTPNSAATLVPSSAGATIRTLDTDSPMPRSASDEPSSASPILIDSGRSTTRSPAIAERPEMRHRPRSNNLSISRRALSPLPPAANLFSAQMRRRPSSRLEAVRKLPGAIIHKTVEILLSPPSHLVNLMLKVAARIAAGEWRGLVFGFNEGGEKIPVQWDYSDGEFSSWEDDDDYTFSMGHRYTTHERAGRTETGVGSGSSADERDRSWEVD
ncbi:inheritance of peroxisomes protein 1-domain-containing protein [Xylariales sp. AK1849]|nr:inheritance of peroxisomes protein 1-domain-containing protein [Xylariales sp. AK1849]